MPAMEPAGTRFPDVDSLRVGAYTIPTDQPESDGTLAWDATTIVVVEASAGGMTGLGYTYGAPACAAIVEQQLAPVVVGAGRSAADVGAAWAAMVHALRNTGVPGAGAMAISAVDTALWDLKARLLGVPLTVALDAMHAEVPIYGSGGFCSYSHDRLAGQLRGWVEEGIPRVKMKIGRDPAADWYRLRVAREAVGPDVALFTDANGAYTRAEALHWAERMGELGVVWFEEPVSSDDLDGLRLLRDRAPAGMDVAAGEYGSTLQYFRALLHAGAVGCLQADVTRCGGYTGLRRVAALCDAANTDLSLHCAPQVSVHGAAGIWHLRHLEWFHDHVRIEGLLFDGCCEPEPGGVLRPALDRPGNGLVFKRADAERYSARGT